MIQRIKKRKEINILKSVKGRKGARLQRRNPIHESVSIKYTEILILHNPLDSLPRRQEYILSRRSCNLSMVEPNIPLVLLVICVRGWTQSSLASICRDCASDLRVEPAVHDCIIEDIETSDSRLTNIFMSRRNILQKSTLFKRKGRHPPHTFRIYYLYEIPTFSRLYTSNVVCVSDLLTPSSDIDEGEDGGGIILGPHRRSFGTGCHAPKRVESPTDSPISVDLSSDISFESRLFLCNLHPSTTFIL